MGCRALLMEYTECVMANGGRSVSVRALLI